MKPSTHRAITKAAHYTESALHALNAALAEKVEREEGVDEALDFLNRATRTLQDPEGTA